MKKIVPILLIILVILTGCSKKELQENEEYMNKEEIKTTVLENEEKSLYVVLTLNMKLQPQSRFALEDTLEKIMDEEEIGEISGGGTGFNPDTKEIEYCDLEIDLYDESYYEKLKDILEKRVMVAKGSKIESDIEKIEIGNLEGMALHLDINNITDEALEEQGDENFIAKLLKLMEKELISFSSYENEKEAVLYFYGLSYDEMYKSIKDYLKENLVFKNYKVEQIA